MNDREFDFDAVLLLMCCRVELQSGNGGGPLFVSNRLGVGQAHSLRVRGDWPVGFETTLRAVEWFGGEERRLADRPTSGRGH